MAVRSKRLFGPSSVALGTVTLYTTPPGETAILKQLTFVNNSVLSNTVLLRLNSDLASSNLIAVVLAGSESRPLGELFIALQPGDFIRAVATASAVIVCGFGAELEGEAD